MVRTLSSRSIVIHPASALTDFLGPGFASKGVAKASLESLSSIYNSSTIMRLSALKPNISERDNRHQEWMIEDETADPLNSNTSAFQVHLFKKFSASIPPGLSSASLVDYYTHQFVFENEFAKAEFKSSTKKLVTNGNYYTIAITALVYDPELLVYVHHIIAATLYMHDKNGSYIFLNAVLD